MKLHPLKIIINNTTDTIYKIYRKNDFLTFKDLYLYLHYYNPFYLTELHNLLNIYLMEQNIIINYPITKPIYLLKSYEYLFNKKIIKYIPPVISSLKNIFSEYINETNIFFREKCHFFCNVCIFY
jgi:hypothetical protein